MPEVGSLFVRLRADASEFESVMKSVSGNVKNAGKAIQGVGDGFSKYVTLPLVGVATAALTVGANFDTQMSKVQALSGGTEADLASLRETALDLGKTTQFSATQAAGGMEALALGGLNANQIITAMPGLLGLAAAEQLGLGTAADITTGIMNTFGISADQTGTTVDQLLSASSNAAVSVEDIGKSLQYAGPAAAAAGMSLADTTTALGLMGNQGIRGSQAGTALGAVLSDLTGKVKDGKVDFGDFAVQIYDAQGQMRPFGDILRDIETGTNGMSDAQRNAALTSVFQRQSLRGVNVLLGEGAGKYDALNAAILDSNGLAETQAGIMSDNLGGAFGKVRAAVEGLLIQISDNLKPAIMTVIIPAILRFIGAISELIGWFGQLSPKVQTIILIVLAIAAAIGPVLVALGLFITLIGTAIGALAVLASPVTLIVLAIAALVLGVIYAYTHFQTFRDIVNGAIGAILAVVQAAIPVVVGILTTAWQTILTVAQMVWPYIQLAVSTALTAIQTVISTLIPLIVPPIQSAFESVLAFAQAAWPQVQAIIQTAASTIQSIIEAVFPVVKAIVEAVFSGILQLAQENWPTIQAIISTAAEIIQTIVSGKFEAVRAVAETVFNAVRSLAETVWPAIRAVIETAMGVVQSVVEAVLGIIRGVWQDTHSQIESYAQQVWDSIRGIIHGALTIIQGILETVLAVIKGDWQGAWDGIKTILEGVWEIIKSIIDLGISAVQTSIDVGLSIVKRTFETAWDGIKRVVQEGVDRVKQLMSDLPGQIVSSLGDLGSLLWQAGADLLNGLINGITSKIGDLKSILDSVTGLIPDWKGPAERDRKLLQPAGVLIMQGLDAGLASGERGIEARLQRLTALLGGYSFAAPNGNGTPVHETAGGLTVTFNVANLNATNRQEAERAADDLTTALRQMLRAKGMA